MTAGTETRFCITCGNVVAVDAPFCEGCGAAQALDEDARKSASLWADTGAAGEMGRERAPARAPLGGDSPASVGEDVASPTVASSQVADGSAVTDRGGAACGSCGAADSSGAAFCESCGAPREAVRPAQSTPPAWPPAIPVGGGELLALIALSALVLVLLCLDWYTAALTGSAPIDASGWNALTIGRVLLLSSSLLIGFAAWSLLAPQAPLARIRVSRSDLGHLAFSLGVLLAAYLVFRVASPPRFYRVTDYAHSYFGSDDSSVHAQVSVHAPAVLALLAAGGWVLVGMRLAVASPEGFSIERCWGVLREYAGSRRPWR